LEKEEKISTKIIKSSIQMFSGSSVNTISAFLSGYFYALILGPSLYGVWQTAKVITSYGTFISLGIPFVMRRDFIMLRNEGKFQDAEKLANVSFSYSLLVHPIVCVVIIVIALTNTYNANFQFALIIVALWYIFVIISGFGNILHKGINDYKTISIAEIIYGISSIFLIPFIYYFGFNALLLGFLLITFMQSLFYYIRRPVKYKFLWDFKILRSIIFIAFPIFLVTITQTVFSTIDRLLIASMLTFQDVGFYSLSSFLSQPLNLLVGPFSIVLFTQLIQKYGRSKEPHVIEKHVTIPQSIFSNILPPVIGMSLIALPVLTNIFLPKYSGGINAAQINIFSLFFYLMAGFSAQALFVLDKQILSAPLFFIAGIIKTFGGYIGIKNGFGIESVAFFSLIAYFFYNASMLFFISRYINYSFNKYLLSLLRNLLCPFLILVFCIIYLLYKSLFFDLISVSNVWIQLIISEIIFVIFCLYFVLNGFNQIKKILKK